MIAFDTNALIRMLVEDDEDQSKEVRNVVNFAENSSTKILILPEVLIETVWVLEAVYKCSRKEISEFLDSLIETSIFTIADLSVISSSIKQYKKGGDFADMVIIGQAKNRKAKLFFSFDKKLKKTYPDFVIDRIKN